MSSQHSDNSGLGAEAMNEYVSVRIGDQLFGAPVDAIREVFAPQSVTHVPLAPDEVAGLLNLRGRIVTAIDARRRLGLTPREKTETGMALGVERGNEIFGLIVDSVGEVLRRPRSELEPVPAHVDARWRSMVKGVHRLEKELLAVLDVSAVIGTAGQTNKAA
ncbi:MAG: chemotaxis protein CheW [Oceanicaulis sp.]|uniref:Chemotaxis protein CheW n=2 Tax=Bacteria TaxID=2 RepID=A0A9W6ILE4_9PROT|nr:chemotaxis protein CheW [Maricaulis virginensis]MAC39057.1 chemotaxis protein CheW [Oceanicaulis sp.]MAZ90645.1 chemotaxis protein CheW [Maricaulis sp.]MBI75066.1 chemotaxis protein CheW [Oceanicaulis sp.]GLK51260.1 chemotaxis protein CheW [Maricaulis virginensis]|tara:strand:+ start:493 stop:978 length:486 start_codon:yes stop_codon:yes gene_type:complete